MPISSHSSSVQFLIAWVCSMCFSNSKKHLRWIYQSISFRVFGFSHSLVDFCAHSRSFPRYPCSLPLTPSHSLSLSLTPAHSRSLPLTPAHSRSLPLTPAHSRSPPCLSALTPPPIHAQSHAYQCSLPRVLMHEFLWENDKSRVILSWMTIWVTKKFHRLWLPISAMSVIRKLSRFWASVTSHQSKKIL